MSLMAVYTTLASLTGSNVGLVEQLGECVDGEADGGQLLAEWVEVERGASAIIRSPRSSEEGRRR